MQNKKASRSQHHGSRRPLRPDNGVSGLESLQGGPKKSQYKSREGGASYRDPQDYGMPKKDIGTGYSCPKSKLTYAAGKPGGNG